MSNDKGMTAFTELPRGRRNPNDETGIQPFVIFSRAGGTQQFKIDIGHAFCEEDLRLPGFNKDLNRKKL
jgi:hypothetical protein